MTRAGMRVLAAGAVLALTAGLTPLAGGTPASAKVSATAPSKAKFSAKAEARKMDAVPTPKLDWYSCYDTAQCVTVKVPRDYDRPNGAKVELALLRVKARDQKHRIGSLFVNPGGPGGSAAGLAYLSAEYFSPKLLDRFDIVGMDPRGIAFSDNVRCSTAREQERILRGYRSAFPLGSKQEKAWIASNHAEGKACSRNVLARSMSTAEVARDMELMRRAVGDKQLTYFGLSYGTYIGQVYANMFPDRFRAVAIDGVLEPVAWAGNKANDDQPLELRLKSSSGAYKALREILVRCDRVGGAQCAFAAGDPLANLRVIADRLRAHPLIFGDPDTGQSFTFTYQDLVGLMLSMLYDPAGYEPLISMLADLWLLTEPPNNSAQAAQGPQAAAAKDLAHITRSERNGRPSWGFPYDNGLDAFASVTCTDSKETTRSAQFPAFAGEADRRAPYFGRLWLWTTSICAGDAFTAEDEDAYTGPFNTKTRSPVLFVGDYYDPATNYNGAVSAAKRMPNSRLLSSDSFGHTAYGTSECTTGAIDAYLLKGTLPRVGKVCVGDIQPFAANEAALSENAVRQQALRRQLTGSPRSGL